MRSLHADGQSRREIWFLLLPAVVLAAWTAWFLRARISQYEVSDLARIETGRTIDIIKSPTAGRFIGSGLTAGSDVKAGDLLFEIDSGNNRRRVLAPVSGKLEDVAALRPGGSVFEGEKLGTIVSSNASRLIAEFSADAGVNRIHAGQPARWRIQGSPSGSGGITAHVTGVADEGSGRTVRVEFALDPSSRFLCGTDCRGTVEVQVDSLSPAVLLLRAAGWQTK